MILVRNGSNLDELGMVIGSAQLLEILWANQNCKPVQIAERG